MPSLGLSLVVLLLCFKLDETLSLECTFSDGYEFYADPTNCSQYYECHKGQKRIYSCAPDFHWNDDAKYCDLASNVDCGLTPITSATEVPTKKPPGFVCPSGLDEHTHYADPDDCSKYYECHNGIAVEYPCAPGFFYNRNEGICDFSENVQCALTRKPSPTQITTPSTKSPGFKCPAGADDHTHYADPKNCSKYFECVSGKATEYSCAPEFFFNAKEGICDFPDNVQCGLTPDPTDITTEPTTKNPGFVCPSGSDQHTHYADPDDCSKYYECHNGKAVEYSCAPGFFFNRNEKICDFPENVQCALTRKPSPTQLTTPSTKSPGFKCPAGADDHTHYADPKNCSKYFECVSGEATEYSCAPGFFFNVKEGICDFPDNVQCGLTPDPTIITTEPTTKNPGFICPSGSDEHTHYADPDDCSKYYECHNRKAVEYSCAPGFFFNRNEKICDFPENVQCALTHKPSPTQLTTPSTKSPGFKCPAGADDHTHYADPKDCSKYYECVSGKATEYSCAPGFFFNVKEGICDFPDNVQCGLTPEPTEITTEPTTRNPGFVCPSGSDEHTHYADPDDCSKYYECHNGKAVEYPCAPGFFFNRNEKICDFPENVQCALTRKPSPTQLTTPSTESPGFKCPAGADDHTHYADPEDCSKYYECVSGQPTEYPCAPGFFFNVKEGICDFPDNVQCGLTPKPTGITTNPTTKNPVFVCPANSDENTRYANPENCSKYFECHNGKAVEYSCATGFLFNAKEGICDFSDDVQCSVSPYPSTEATTPLPTTKTPDFKCPVVSDENIHYADPDDCSKYYVCLKGKATEYYCASGFLYNKDTGICDFEENVHCDSTPKTTEAPVTKVTTPVPITIPTDSTPKTSPSEAPVTKVTTPVPITIPTAPSTAATTPKVPSCAGKPDGTYLSHPDCRKFIECAGGKEYTLNCATGTTWDEEELTCNSKRTNC